jgi:putative colanic acid biosynthesis UDP-glucose lipid carrier transferase
MQAVLNDSKTLTPIFDSNSEISEIRLLFREINRSTIRESNTDFYLMAKRILDLSVAIVFMVLVMSWLFPIIALLIVLDSRGPIFFIQKRTGYKGREFNCYKFRTMTVNADADRKQATANDKRITRIGKFLRATYLDETAQFFNVLFGDMSIVGPRPHMLYHTEYYSAIIPYYHLRHEVTPGMTGMAQVKGYVGEIVVERDLRKRIQWDVYYLKHRSFWLDIRIIFTTFFQVLGKGLNLLKRSGTSDRA